MHRRTGGKPWDAERRDAAERRVLEPDRSLGLVDVRRYLRVRDPDPTWVWHGAAGRTIGRRFNHVLASLDRDSVRFSYRHDRRQRLGSGEPALSDHSGAVVDFAVSPSESRLA